MSTPINYLNTWVVISYVHMVEFKHCVEILSTDEAVIYDVDTDNPLGSKLFDKNREILRFKPTSEFIKLVENANFDADYMGASPTWETEKAIGDVVWSEINKHYWK